jgi:hypothetical protein
MPLKTKCTPPESMQIVANSMTPKSRKVYDFYLHNAPDEKYLVKFLSSLEEKI